MPDSWIRGPWHLVSCHEEGGLDHQTHGQTSMGSYSMWSLIMKARYGLGSTGANFHAGHSSLVIRREIMARALEMISIRDGSRRIDGQ